MLSIANRLHPARTFYRTYASKTFTQVLKDSDITIVQMKIRYNGSTKIVANLKPNWYKKYLITKHEATHGFQRDLARQILAEKINEKFKPEE